MHASRLPALRTPCAQAALRRGNQGGSYGPPWFTQSSLRSDRLERSTIALGAGRFVWLKMQQSGLTDVYMIDVSHREFADVAIATFDLPQQRSALATGDGLCEV